MIVGGAAVGAFGSGLIAQLTTRWLTMKKLPPLPTTVMRGAGRRGPGPADGDVGVAGRRRMGGRAATATAVSDGNGTGETKTEADKSPAKVAGGREGQG